MTTTTSEPMTRFTPTEQRFLDLLSDGQPHGREELRGLLNDSLCDLSRIQIHVSRLRAKLRPLGQDIVCELGGGIHYRHVRLLANPYDGRS